MPVNEIILKSDVLVIDKVLKKTNARMFKDLKEGDRIKIIAKVEAVGRNRGTYATYMEVINLATGECTWKTFNELPSILSNFEFVGGLI